MNECADGSVIVSEGWRTCLNIAQYRGYRRQAVKHSENFVDPQAGANTLTVQSL